MRPLSHAAHAPVSSRTMPTAIRRLRSRPPTLGTGGRRHPVSPEGFEAIPGYHPNSVATAPARRDISELTYGPAAPRLQVGTIASQQVVVPETTQYPWRVTAALQITVPGKSEPYHGTGWFIGPYAVITAAHAVFPREAGGHVGWATEIEVIPAQNGASPPPYGTMRSITFQCPTAWQADGDVRVDYGVVILETPVGAQLGAFGYAINSDSDLATAMANLSGYPTLAPDGSGESGRQWYAAGTIQSLDDVFIYYSLDTRAGESGSCVYRNIGEDCFAMAIHTAASGAVDRGLRIIEPVFDNLQAWAATGELS